MFDSVLNVPLSTTLNEKLLTKAHSFYGSLHSFMVVYTKNRHKSNAPATIKWKFLWQNLLTPSSLRAQELHLRCCRYVRSDSAKIFQLD